MKVRLIKQRGTMELKSRRRLQRIMELAQELAGLDGEQGTLNVILTEASAMAEMNGQFLQHEGRTDVLTFDLRGDGTFPVDGDDCVAEVYVCPDVAVEYSAKFGTTPSSELVLYIVHGMLHLAGEDDLEDDARALMRQAEARVMDGIRERFSVEGFIC
ncbi:MAG: rRNA maturation RNase YbeY [Victivallales bacterium]|nr:rRNA maturation RNase YbeY [Victivallales bacterium]